MSLSILLLCLTSSAQVSTPSLRLSQGRKTRSKLAVLTATLLWSTSSFAASEPDAIALLQKVTQKVGTISQLQAKNDVEYTYLYRSPDGKVDLSIERYIFDGEQSWAKYIVHEKNVSPDVSGDLIQSSVDGNVSVSINHQPVKEEKTIKLAAFLRPTNFYWFAMNQKLLDPGTVVKMAGKRKVGDIEYTLVDLTFEQENTDRYLLYINPETLLIDQFLFTVIDFGRTQPLLMTINYEEVDGITLPTRRRYAPAKSWTGELEADTWTDEIMMMIRFGNGFTKEDFKI